MKIINPSFEILGDPDFSAILQNIEAWQPLLLVCREQAPVSLLPAS